MSERPLFPRRDVSYTDSDIVQFKDIDISTVAEKIVDDIRTVKLDSEEKVNKVKERIADILRFYKWKPVERQSTALSDRELDELRRSTVRSMRRSVTNICRKAKLDAAVISLHDKAVTEETKHNINRQVIDEGLNRLKDKTVKELRRIDEQTKALTSATKSAVHECIKINIPQGSGSSAASCTKENGTFADLNAQTQKLVEKARNGVMESAQVFFTNPAGKKLEEEIESEKFIAEQINKLNMKFQEDLKNQKVVLDQTVKSVKDKTEKLLPFQYYNDSKDDVDINDES